MKKAFIVFIAAFFLFFSLGLTKTMAAGSHLLIINKQNNSLAYYKDNKLQKIFRVATGKKAGYTPEGKFKIVTKIVNRPYYKGKIKGGDPRNPLGNRWMGLNARGTWGDVYAIHGNNNPNSIGKYVSNGCIRMYDQEVEWLYSQVPKNTPVIIATSNKSFDAIGKSYGYKLTGGNKALPSNPSSEILKKGSKGESVRQLQQRLTSLGYSTKGIDGYFGVNTDAAVRKFQRDHRLAADGIVGPSTKKALGLK